jgi:hypothetical protein
MNSNTNPYITTNIFSYNNIIYNNDNDIQCDSDIYTITNINSQNILNNTIDNTIDTNDNKPIYFPLDNKSDKYIPTMSQSFNIQDYNIGMQNYIYNLNIIPEYPTLTKKTHIIIYTINNFNINPFLLFLLYKKNNTIDFLYIDESNNGDIFYKMFKISKTNIEYSGYKMYNGEIFLFFKYVEINNNHLLNISDILDSNTCWITIHELINLQRYINILIPPNIVLFFINNSDIILLYKECGKILFEIPIIAYTNNNYNDFTFIKKFGIKRNDNNALYGPFYYFYNYNIDNIDNINNKYIIRYVLFLGKHNIININQNNSNTYTICVNNLISKYNSIVINNIYIIKQYEQQIPLSYNIL